MYRFIFISAVTAVFMLCANAANNAGQTVDDVHPSILEERRKLQAKANHFVGKIDVLGTLKHAGTKSGKTPQPKNPELVVWNGNLKLQPGILPTDRPELVAVPSNLASHYWDLGLSHAEKNYCGHYLWNGWSRDNYYTYFNTFLIVQSPALEQDPDPRRQGPMATELSNNNKSCLKPEKTFPATTATRINAGPKADGFQQTDFLVCALSRAVIPRFRAKTNTLDARRFKRGEAYSHSSNLWNDPTNIRSAFDPSTPSQMRAAVVQTITLIRESSCLQFVTLPGNVDPLNYTHIIFAAKGGPCTSDRIGPQHKPPHPITVDVSNCGNSVGNIFHAIGHALGLTHTHKRVDRDQSVKVFDQNVADIWKYHFQKDHADYFDSWDIPYYYDSAMHYSPYAASKNGLMTICSLDPLMEAVMGQREAPSFGDIALLNRIYCRESCFEKSELTRGKQFTGELSRTISSRRCQNWSSQTPHKHKFASVGNHSYCRNPDNWEGGPWCYTTDPAVPYEPCFGACEEMGRRFGCKGWCANGGYHDFREACGNCRCPAHASGPLCENVNQTKLYGTFPCSRKVELKNIGNKATLSSRDYPNNYPHNRLCILWIEAPKNALVKLTIEDFLLETPDNNGCHDYVEIRPSICATAIEHPDKMRFCGNSLAPQNGVPRQLYSDDNNLVIKFYSDATESAKGFKVVAEAVAAA